MDKKRALEVVQRLDCFTSYMEGVIDALDIKSDRIIIELGNAFSDVAELRELLDE